MLKYSKNEWRVLLMNISKNVKYIANDISLWRTYTNRRYKVKVQKADKNKIYNASQMELRNAYTRTTASG